MKEDLQNFDRRMGHRRFEILIPITGIKKVWSRLFGKKEAPVYKPDDIDRAIDKAIERMVNQQSTINPACLGLRSIAGRNQQSKKGETL